jgi:hypothetical protein
MSHAMYSDTPFFFHFSSLSSDLFNLCREKKRKEKKGKKNKNRKRTRGNKRSKNK